MIGKLAWGGVVGISLQHSLMDGGVVTAPSAHSYNPEGKYDIENQGVAPDIEVELDPLSVRQGHDPQLEKAVEVVMAELEKNPVPPPSGPRFRGISGSKGASAIPARASAGQCQFAGHSSTYLHFRLSGVGWLVPETL